MKAPLFLIIGVVLLGAGIALWVQMAGTDAAGGHQQRSTDATAGTQSTDQARTGHDDEPRRGMPAALAEAFRGADVEALRTSATDHRQLNTEIADPTLRRFADRDLPLAQRAPDDLLNLLHDVQDEPSKALVRAILLDQTDDVVIRHEAANLLWRSEDALLVPVLLYVAFDPQEGDTMRGYAAQHLSNAVGSGLMSTEQCILAMASLLEQAPGRELEAEALLTLVRLGDAETTKAVAQPNGRWITNHPTVVLQAWSESGSLTPDQEHAVLALLESDDRSVALAAIGTVATLRLGAARDRLEAMGRSDVPSIARAARYALTRMPSSEL